MQAQIAAFHHDSVMYPGVEIGGPPGYDSVEQMREKIEQDETYKIVHEGRCIGGIVVFAKGQGHYHLDVIFIEPTWHNRGIGSQAMEFLERMYPARLWTLDTPTYALRNQHFYEKFGYMKVAEHEIEGTPLFAYEKRGMTDDDSDH